MFLAQVDEGQSRHDVQLLVRTWLCCLFDLSLAKDVSLMSSFTYLRVFHGYYAMGETMF